MTTAADMLARDLGEEAPVGTAAPLKADDMLAQDLQQLDGSVPSEGEGKQNAKETADQNGGQQDVAQPGAADDVNKNQQPNQIVSHETSPSLTEQAIRQAGLSSRDFLETAVSPLTGIGDLANAGINAVTGGINTLSGTKIPQLGMPSQDVSNQLTNLTNLPQPESTSEKLGSAATRIAGSLATMGENLAPTAKALVSGVENLFTKDPTASSAAMKAVANPLYKAATAEGASYTSSLRDKLIGMVKDAAPQEEGEAVGSTPVVELAKRLELRRNTPMTLNGAQEIDEHLGDLIDSEYNMGKLSKQGQKLLDVQRNFRGMITNPEPSDIIGDGNGADLLAQGRQAWHQAAKMQDVERLMARAQGSPNAASIMQNGARTMLANPARTRGWDDDELAALRSARDPHVGQKLVKMIGSKATPYIAGAVTHMLGGGEVADLAAAGVGRGAEAMGQAAGRNMQTTKMRNVLNTLAQDYPALTSLRSTAPTVPASAAAIPALSALTSLRSLPSQQQPQ